MHVANEAKQQILDHWGIIRQGRITGGELLLSELLKEDMTQKEAACLAVLIVSRIGNADLSVGGEPQIKWCRNRRTWHYKEFNYRKLFCKLSQDGTK